MNHKRPLSRRLHFCPRTGAYCAAFPEPVTDRQRATAQPEVHDLVQRLRREFRYQPGPELLPGVPAR